MKISSRRMRNKEVQVIPWVLSDSNHVRCMSPRLDPQKTVFVGALHGMLTAEGLCNIFNDLFGGVVYAGALDLPLVVSLNVSCLVFFQVSIRTSTSIQLVLAELRSTTAALT